MRRIMLTLLLCLVPVLAFAQGVTMTTAQKVPLTATAADAAGAPVPIPQTGVTVQWSSNCPTCTISGGYDTTAKAWSTWFTAGTDVGAFTVTLVVIYATGQKFTATQSVTINDVVIIPASVKIVPGAPVAK